MFKKVLYLTFVLISILMSGCIAIDHAEAFPPNTVFYVHNTTSEIIFVDYAVVEGKYKDPGDKILPDATTYFAVFGLGSWNDAGWVTIDEESLPSKHMQSLTILSLQGDTLYRQEPIVDSLWTVQKTPMWGETGFDYEYTFSYPVVEKCMVSTH